MLAKSVDALPAEGDYLFEPKWDGFRAIVFRSRSPDVSIQSRDLRPLDRYFPELHEALIERLPAGCIVDGEIVVAAAGGLDFDALQQRLHPAASRVAKLALATPASFVAFDLLAVAGASLRDRPQDERRGALEQLLADAAPPLHLTPATRDRDVASAWLREFEGAGLDGVIAKPLAGAYQPGKRAMLKIKHVRSADCVVAGFRWHKSTEEGGPRGDRLAPARPVRRRRRPASRRRDLVVHDGGPADAGPGAGAARAATPSPPIRGATGPSRTPPAKALPAGAAAQRMPGATSRWSAGKDLSWQPLRIERVCEVKYDHLQGDRFRHATTFLRWRPDKPPEACRYDQLEVVPPYELKRIFRI